MALTQISTQGIKDGTITGSDLATNVDLIDDQKLRLGTGNDLEIYHTGAASLIDNKNANNFFIRNLASNIYYDALTHNLRNSAGTEVMAVFTTNGSVELYHDNSKKFETTSDGVKISGAEGVEAILSFEPDDGDNASDKFRFRASDSAGFFLENGSSNETSIKANFNGSVELYHDNSKKFETTSGGATISGGTNALTVNHSGGDAIDCVRGGKTLSLNANFGAANTHSAINISSGMELRFQVNASDKVKLDSSGNWVPASNNARSLGTSSLRWSDVYTNDLHLSNEGSSNDMDGTWGDWTMQEGESDLFLKNNRSGKKYKFNLTEVS
jgi:hypothetical protein